MTKIKKEKLSDYLLGLKSLSKSGTLPVGVLILEESDLAQAEKAVKAEKIAVLLAEEKKEEAVLKKITDGLKKDKPMALVAPKNLSPKIISLLNSLSFNNTINSYVSGEKDRVALKISPKRSFIILLMNEKQYDDAILQDTASSFCNLL